MDDCQTPEVGNDRSFSSVCDNTVNTHHKVSEVNAIMNENISAEKESECNPKSDGVGLSDNFILDLLSRDSTTHAELSEQKVEAHDSFGNNAAPSAADSFKIHTLGQSKPNDMVVTKSEISSCDKFEAVNTENDVANLERETGANKSAADVVKSSPTDKQKCKTDCELRLLEETQSNSVTEIFEVEMIKEVVIKDSSSTVVEKEKPAESTAKDTFVKSAYRCESNSSTDDEDSTTSDSSSSDSSFFQEMCERSKPKKLPFVKTKGELGLDDLPPIEDLVISVNEGEMSAIGKIYAVVDKLVVIRALKGMKALDLDSVLFLSHEQPLGRVFDVFGPVNEPFYSVRFNTVDEINEKGVKVSAEVFFAPEKSDITSYVFVEKLQNQKGSDASWKHNNEPPEEFLDFSDDEKEKSAKQQRRLKNRNRQFNSSDAPAKRPLLTDDSSNYIPPPKPARGWNSQNISLRVSRPNPFQSRIPPMSPSPSVCSLMSPVRTQNPFASSPNPPRRPPQPQNILYRSSPQLLISPYQQPHVFGQVAVLNHLAPSPLHSPVMNNVPALIPASPFSAPQNYFSQAFSRSPSPSTHAQHMPIDPWLSNRSHHSSNIPPSHPLTVQIPSMNNPSLPMHQFPQERGPMQPFVNFQNGNFSEPFINNNRNFPNGNMQSRFYR